MHLKRLELSGFKSFASKTALEFPRGISVIVGPNGSGKSNLADAIRWTLGEQSMKTIRATKSEELIFSGTPQRAASGMASVSIYFDNSDKFFPEDMPEITISRKLYRGGESEYLLNKNPVRLKDVAVFLAKARLGVHGFCVVSQGAADVILAASSKEKRNIIEEALGLKEFQLKKTEAERKIGETKINLEKISSMLQEIAPHLRYLKRRVNKFEKRADLEQELKKLQKAFFGRELHNFTADFRKLTEEKSACFAEFQKRRWELDRLEEEIKKEEGKTPQYFREFEILEEKIGRLQEEKNRMLREFGKIEGLIEAEKTRPAKEGAAETPSFDANLLLGRLENIKRMLAGLLEYDSLEEIKSGIQEIVNLIDNLTPSSAAKTPEGEPPPISPVIAHLSKEKETISQNLDSVNRKIDELNRAFQELREKNKSEVAAVASRTRTAQIQKNELREAENILRNLELAEAKLKIKEEDLKTKIREAGLPCGEIEEFGRNISAGSLDAEDSDLLAVDPVALEEKIFKIKRDLGEIGAIDEDLMREYKETGERHEFLQSQSEDLQKAINALTGLIGELEEKINREFGEALVKINESFNRFFQLMFGGGGAKLVKTIVSAPEESANWRTEYSPPAKEEVLEIKVDLPRKKIKSLDMLSGGERAITSIALLFGIIATSPPPFLILDEIDAALDEANSQKFARLLKDLSKETQFILITHNRQTMNEADVLYGVTMEKEGVSRLLSLKLEEAEEIGRQYKE